MNLSVMPVGERLREWRLRRRLSQLDLVDHRRHEELEQARADQRDHRAKPERQHERPGHIDDKPRWSPDGKTIYFVSDSGGFFNVWGIRFDAAAGKPVGLPFRVSHFDSPRLMIPRYIPPVELSLAQAKLVLTMAQESGNIWILDNVDR